MPSYDRSAHDYGNIIKVEHVNLCVPDQRLATLFYITGMGLTRDPFVNTGINLMWLNIGQCQFHLPTAAPQRVRGITGLVMPDLAELVARLETVAPMLKDTEFAIEPGDNHVDLTSPWGDRLRCHAPDPARFGPIRIGLPYIEFATAPGTAAGIGRFYREVMGTPATLFATAGLDAVKVSIGRQWLLFREQEEPLPDYDGHHIQVYVTDFSGPYDALAERGLITRETNEFEYRFATLFDPADGRSVYTLEHEIRTISHPGFGRELLNRDPAQQGLAYRAGRDRLPIYLS